MHLRCKWRVKVLVAHLGLTLCDPMDCSPPGSSVHGILQARIPEWIAFSFSRGFPDPGIIPGSLALQADSLPPEPPGKPWRIKQIFFFSHQEKTKFHPCAQKLIILKSLFNIVTNFPLKEILGQKICIFYIYRLTIN